MKQNLYLILILFCAASVSYAQSFEIRAVVVDASTIGIEMRETSGNSTPSTTDFVTDIVFGLKWANSTNNNLGAIDNSGPDYNIVKSDGELIIGLEEFQAFAASSTPFNFPETWSEDIWVEICQVASSNGNFTGTIDICPLGFDSSTGPNIGLNLTDYTPTINGSANFTVLPASLGKFEVFKEKEYAHLTWGTTSEVNVSHFEIEKSSDGLNWNYVNEVRAEGNSNQNIGYEYYDYSTSAVVIEGTVYYRLKMVDIDGTFEYSDVRSLDYGHSVINALSIAPNPSSHIATISFSKGHEFSSLRLLDVSGRLLYESSVSNLQQIELDLEKMGLSEGLYLLFFETIHQEQQVEKLLVK
jgi:hypothetical protein